MRSHCLLSGGGGSLLCSRPQPPNQAASSCHPVFFANHLRHSGGSRVGRRLHFIPLSSLVDPPRSPPHPAALCMPGRPSLAFPSSLIYASHRLAPFSCSLPRNRSICTQPSSIHPRAPTHPSPHYYSTASILDFIFIIRQLPRFN